jgi:hypothetical protein
MLNPYFSGGGHRKKPTQLFDVDGNPIETVPEPRTWCKLAFSVSLVPPKIGQVFSIEQGPFTRRLVIYAPRPVVIAATTALLGSVPWVQQVVQWALHLAR